MRKIDPKEIFSDVTEELWDREIDTNLKGSLWRKRMWLDVQGKSLARLAHLLQEALGGVTGISDSA